MGYVMHGSYNWIPTANYNKETLATALIMNLSQSLLKSLWNYIMGLIFKRRQTEIFRGAEYGFK